MTTFLKRLAGFSAACGIALAAQAQPGFSVVNIVVPQPAGNPTDGVARKLQPLLQKELGLTVIVENAPGAGGAIGVQKALNQTQANTLSLLIVSQTEPILTPMTLKQARYQPEDLQAVAVVARLPYVLAARSNLPASTPAQVADLAKASSAPLSFGNIGNGSMIHLLGEQWGRLNGVSLNQVSYKGVPPVAQDLMGSQIDLSFLPLGGATLSMVQSGKLKAIATSGAASPKQLPGLPSIAKSDAKMAGFVYGTWIALLAPAKTPAATVELINRAIVAALRDPDLQTYVTTSGMDPVYTNSLPELAQFYKAETRLYQDLARKIGVTVE
jgi:tripartite-type tricarboxylate transporter receptor subunit TctC